MPEVELSPHPAPKGSDSKSNASKGATSDASSAKSSANMRPRRTPVFPLADSYLFSSVVGATLRGLGWFAGLFLAFAVVTSAQRVAQKGVPISIAVEAIALQMPRIILFTIPASLLFGVVSTFTEMSSKGEITALMAGGMSLRRMLRGPLVFALGLSLLSFWLQEVIVPGAELRKGNLLLAAAKSIDLSNGFTLVNKRSDGTVETMWHAESFDIPSKTLIKPVIQFYKEDNSLDQQIKGESARWDSERRVWILKKQKSDAFVEPSPHAANSGMGQTRRAHLEADEAVIKTDKVVEPDAFNGGERSARDQIEKFNFEMVSWQQLAADRTEKVAQYKTAKGDERKDLRKLIRADTYGIHDKFATPLIVLALVLFGAPLGVRPQRTASAGLAMGLSLMVILGYYVLWTLCTQTGKGGAALPQLLAYIPSIVTATLGTILIARKS